MSDGTTRFTCKGQAIKHFTVRLSIKIKQALYYTYLVVYLFI